MPPGFMEEARIRAEQIREEDALAAAPVTRTPVSGLKTLEHPQAEMGESLQKFVEHLRSLGLSQIYPPTKMNLPSTAVPTPRDSMPPLTDEDSEELLKNHGSFTEY